MIQGVNFIVVERWPITYGRMALMFAGVILFCLLFYFFQTVRLMYFNQKVSQVQSEIVQIKARQEQTNLQASQSPSRVVLSVQHEIKPMLEKMVSWSEMLNEVSRKLPPQLWLQSFKSHLKNQVVPAIILNGSAYDMGSISVFVNLLERSPHFRSVVLINTTREEQGEKNRYSFSIETEVIR